MLFLSNAMVSSNEHLAFRALVCNDNVSIDSISDSALSGLVQMTLSAASNAQSAPSSAQEENAAMTAADTMIVLNIPNSLMLRKYQFIQ
jgi:hypothetical protein